MARLEPAPWWSMRRSQSRRPRTYSCPLCGRQLPAMVPHMLIAPEGDGERRRHAHMECVARARQAGKLPTRDEWRKTQPRPPSLWRRLLGRD